MLTGLIVVLVIGFVVALIGAAVNSDIGPTCGKCGHHAQTHRYFENFGFPCRGKEPYTESDGTIRLGECACYLSEAEVRANAHLAEPAPERGTSSNQKRLEEIALPKERDCPYTGMHDPHEYADGGVLYRCTAR